MTLIYVKIQLYKKFLSEVKPEVYDFTINFLFLNFGIIIVIVDLVCWFLHHLLEEVTQNRTIMVEVIL